MKQHFNLLLILCVAACFFAVDVRADEDSDDPPTTAQIATAHLHIRKKITEDEADKILALAYFGSLEWKNSFDYQGDDSLVSPPFYAYQGIGSGPAGVVNLNFGFFAVNPWTGTVWNLWDCKKISTQASLKLQAQIKKRFTAKEMKKYRWLSNLKPECV